MSELLLGQPGNAVIDIMDELVRVAVLLDLSVDP